MPRNRVCKTHFRSIAFKNNAGIDFPVCRANAKLLDMELTNSKITNDAEKVDCKQCKKIMNNNFASSGCYSWS